MSLTVDTTNIQSSVYTINKNINSPNNANPYSQVNKTNNCFINCIGGCGICSVIIFALGAIGASIAYIVFSIMALVENNSNMISERCEKSNIWEFILTSLILNFISINNSKVQAKSASKEEDFVILFWILIFQILLSSVIGTWGSLEIYNSDCAKEKLSSLLIYKMAEITTIIHISMVGISIAIIIGCIIYVLKKETTNIKKVQSKNLDNSFA